MKENYIKGIIGLLTEGKDPDVVLRGLRTTLASRGHEALLPGILQGVLSTLEEQKEGTLPRVTVGRAADAEKLKAAIVDSLHSLGAAEAFETQVDETIVGGFIAHHDHQIVDKSYKSALVSLYRNIAE